MAVAVFLAGSGHEEIDGAEAVVTDASGGLGGAIAGAPYARGALAILAVDGENLSRLWRRSLGGAEMVVCDLADRGQRDYDNGRALIAEQL